MRENVYKKSLIASIITDLAIYFIWVIAEVLVYGEVQERAVDNIIYFAVCVITSIMYDRVFCYANLKREYRKLQENLFTKLAGLGCINVESDGITIYASKLVDSLRPEVKDGIYNYLRAQKVREDVEGRCIDRNIKLNDLQIDNVVKKYVLDGMYSPLISYWDNLDSLIDIEDNSYDEQE